MKMTAPFILRWAQTNTQNRTTITMMSPMWGAPDAEEKVLDWKQQERLQLKQTRTLSLLFFFWMNQVKLTVHFSSLRFHTFKEWFFTSVQMFSHKGSLFASKWRKFLFTHHHVYLDIRGKKTTKEGPSEILIPSKYLPGEISSRLRTSQSPPFDAKCSRNQNNALWKSVRGELWDPDLRPT